MDPTMSRSENPIEHVRGTRTIPPDPVDAFDLRPDPVGR